MHLTVPGRIVKTFSLVVLLAGCAGPERSDDSLVDVEATGEGPHVLRDGSSLPEMAYWPDGVAVTIDRGCREPRCTVDAIAVDVVNLAPDPVQVTVWLRGAGLDGREARVRIDGQTSGAVQLAGGQSQRFTVAASALPIQGVGTVSSLRAELTAQRGAASVASLSAPIGVEHDAAYRNAFTYDLAGQVARSAELDPALIERPIGRVWTGDRFADVTTLPPIGVGYTLGGGFTSVGDASPLRGGVARRSPPAPLVDRRVCFLLKVSYIDAGFGEDAYNAPAVNGVPDVQLVPAAFLEAYVASINTTPWSGHLDAEGCTPLVALDSAKKYTIHVESVAVRTIGSGDVSFEIRPPTGTQPVFWNRSFSVQSATTIHASPTTWDNQQNVVAVASRMLEESADWLSPGNTVVRVDLPCPPDDPPSPPSKHGSCVDDGIIYIAGEQSSSSPAHAWSKFLVAHQIGHRIQGATLTSAGLSFGLSDPTHALCRCEQLSSGDDDQCTQSLEEYAAALYEGFAHFTAAIAFNERGQADCQFMDYRPLHILFGVIPAPAPIDCAMKFQWRDTYCDDQPATATALDFTRFLWRLHTQGPDQLSAAEITEIITAATALGEIDFGALSIAAEDLLGPGSPRWENFVDLAKQQSVD
jgi:hypothetical protein